MIKETDASKIRAESDFDRQIEWMEDSKSDTTTVPVSAALEKSDFFEVNITDYDDNITEGENLNVTVEIFNSGAEPGEQVIELKDFENNTVDNRLVEIPDGTSIGITLTWNTQTGDGGTGKIKVTSEDDKAFRWVSIIPPNGIFEITSFNINPNPALKEETVKIATQIKNTGTENGERSIKLIIDRTLENEKSISLEPNEKENIEFRTTINELGVYSVKIDSVNDEKTENLEIVKIREENVVLNAGWNIFSLPVDPENHRSKEIFSDLDYYPDVVGWTDQYKIIREDDKLELGEGYWVYTREKENITVQGEPLEEFNLELNQGWNISGVPKQISPKKASKVFENLNYFPDVVGWTNQYIIIREDDNIEPKEGYWVYLRNEENLSISS